MKKLTSIKQVGSNKYSLIIDGKKHIVYDDVLLEYNLLKKGEIEDSVYQAIVNTNNYHEAYNKMLKYITVKLRTEKEVREKLTKLFINKSDQDKIVQRLRKEKYIDDNIYVKSYINDQLLLTLNGPKKIFYELKRLGFNEDLINNYLEAVDSNLWYDKTEKILNKKLKSNHNLSQKMFINKLRKDYNNLGYEEKYFNHHLDSLEFDDSNQLNKDYQKVYNKLSKKYTDVKLKIKIKQKLFQLGYDLDKINMLIDTEDY